MSCPVRLSVFAMNSSLKITACAAVLVSLTVVGTTAVSTAL
ncbi:hypothetical protein PF001_g30537 [Phytophthora fragariae]|uniref:Uncharacterized protein n=2 Tax=Phytophthora TaxID=4783 RepID=A0A6A3DE13_9STRA|nr:hypothetical protein PF009_g31154 [Phytophthora fragariae]KAE8979791.1 hypothetical protein PR001_g24451 [Phytophthora rubi]KAE9266299.1 hypothetical protein PF001_g30537 [Phytophthora fragariae]